MDELFERCERNPILTAQDMPFPAQAVYNPGVTEQDGQVVLLLRVEDATGYSRIHVARSANGVTGWRVETKPLLVGGPEHRYEQWGCEDPRVTWMPEDRCWYIAYAAYSSSGVAVGLARTTDLETVERIGLILPPSNKDAALFPRKFGGRYAALHRPDAAGLDNIWIAFSRDLAYWGEPHCVLEVGAGPAWDAVAVGAGPPPIETDRGWLLLHHGVKMYGGSRVYRVGAALLDRNAPHKILARSRGSLFYSSEPYELSGLVPNVIFPTGTLLRGEELWVYYGAADTCVCLAKVSLPKLLARLSG